MHQNRSNFYDELLIAKGKTQGNASTPVNYIFLICKTGAKLKWHTFSYFPGLMAAFGHVWVAETDLGLLQASSQRPLTRHRQHPINEVSLREHSSHHHSVIDGLSSPSGPKRRQERFVELSVAASRSGVPNENWLVSN
jgi:hypothetical protein